MYRWEQIDRDEKNVVNWSSVHVVYIFIKSNNNVVNMGLTISASLHDCDLLGGMNLRKKSVWFFFLFVFSLRLLYWAWIWKYLPVLILQHESTVELKNVQVTEVNSWEQIARD